MNDNTKTGIIIGLIFGAINAIAVSIAKERMEEKFEHERWLMKEATKEAKQAVENISDEVDKAVKFIYENEAKDSFERRLKKMDFDGAFNRICNEIAEREHRETIARLFTTLYRDNVNEIVRAEIKYAASDFIAKKVNDLIDDDFVKETAKTKIKSVVSTKVEELVQDEVDDVDFDDLVKEYLEDNEDHFEKIFKKASKKYLEEQEED